ncbi:hypothetical protein CFC21_008339 [Triticum aestivum]|uniref:AAA+ ATPase domain-containing protein n=2 Tax=Triticum aestivum TaxID=4565 RepID=A0A9R1DFU0_WHEAT|nr:hypothetical protein CFC21_008339 [Triticum aestivum]
MEAALVGVGVGVMKPLLEKLFKLSEEEYARLKVKGLARQVEATRDEMCSMTAALEALEDAEQLDPEMIPWRDDVRELSYDMEDCIDDFTARLDHEGGGHTGLKGFFDKLKKLKPSHEIAVEFEKLKARAIEASKRHKRYKNDFPIPNSITSEIDPRLHALYVDVAKIVGMDDPKKHIIERLKNEDFSTPLQVVSIVGTGGLEKTTLANAVYQAIKGEFSCSALVSVSRKPNMKNVLRDIAERVGISHSTSNDDERRLIDRLRDHLQNEKYLIVIDDIWSTEAWETIRDALLNNDHGSRIITTTRNSTVASHCCSGTGYVYKMKPLSPADSRSLFLQRAFGSEDLFPPHLENVSGGILQKCEGLPLAIITMSSLLADQTAEEEWNRALAAIGSSLAKESHAEALTKILSLSYFDLPHPMRTCLLYFSAFPEDHIIKKRNLIHKWIAEGFIHEEPHRSAYGVGESYFYGFINRSLIQAHDIKYGQVETCKVHDIILDFITCKASEENFMTTYGDAEHRKKHKIRRLSVMSRYSEMAAVPGDLSHVRSLAMFGNFGQNSLLSFPALRVLDLGECRDLENSHLTNIGKLFLLKYLRLGSDKITELPCKIGDLQYLETLDIKGTTIAKLPSTITRLQRLTRLYVENCANLSDGIIGQLQSLEELENVHVCPSRIKMPLVELDKLTNLRTLSVSILYPLHFCHADGAEDVGRFVGILISSCNLHHLRIDYMAELTIWGLLSLESWRPTTPSVLLEISITNYHIDKVPNWMISPVNLRALDISLYRMGPEDVEILGAMPVCFS